MFRPAPVADGLADGLWAFARSAYLDNPLPPLLKERLFVHLSRFCKVRHCIIRHLRFLTGDDNPGPGSLTLDQAVRLLRRPLPDRASVDQTFREMEALARPGGLPAPDTENEAWLFDALAVIYLDPSRSARAREAVRATAGTRHLEMLTAFLVFVRAAHHWSEAHPELDHEPDTAAFLRQHPGLAELLPGTCEARDDGVADRHEARQAFLLKLSDALHPLADPADIPMTACRVLGEHTGASRVLYGEVVRGDEGKEAVVVLGSYVDGVAPVGGILRVEEFGRSVAASYRKPEAVVFGDARTDTRLGEDDRRTLAAMEVVANAGIPLVEDGRWTAVMALHQARPRQWSAAELALLEETAARVGGAMPRARAEMFLRESEERFRTLAQGIPQLVWRSANDGMWTWASPQWLDYTGQTQEQSRGWGWLEAVHPDDRGDTMQAWHDARGHGELDVEYRIRRAADGAWRWHTTRSLPVHAPPMHLPPTHPPPDPDGAPHVAEHLAGPILEWLGTSTDIDELKRMQNQQQVLVAELQHRTRNLLALVRSLARRSIPASAERDEYDARLAALSRVQGFLSRSTMYAVPLLDLVRAELQAAGDGLSDREVVNGPPVDLPGESVQVVALALHELATNAVKHGAFAQASGRLSVTWRVEPAAGSDASASGEQRLVLDWRETGVAMPAGPIRRSGYGSELITQALPYQLRAENTFEFGPDGVWCRIILPDGMFRHQKAGEPGQV